MVTTDSNNLEKKLENELFPGTKSVTGNKDEKLITFSIVLDENVYGMDGKAPPLTEKNEFDLKDKDVFRAYRLVCFTENKSDSKIRAYKVKMLRDKTLIKDASWLLDDLQSIECISSDKICAFFQGKKNNWIFESPQKANIFILSCKQVFDTYLKKPLKLINTTEASLKKDIPSEAQSSKFEGERKGSTVTINVPVKPSTVEGGERLNSTDSALEIDILFKEFLDGQVSNFGDLENSLNKELAALESANVHALFHAGDASQELLSYADDTVSGIEVIDAAIRVYSENLSSVGDEIQQIEFLNKGLQQQIVNQERLLEVLDDILGKLCVPDMALEILQTESFENSSSIGMMEEAAEVLKKAIQTKFDNELDNLKAVVEQKETLMNHSRSFGSRLLEFCKKFFKQQAEGCYNAKGRFSKRGILKLSFHDSIHESVTHLKNLFKWLLEIDPVLLSDLLMAYQSALIPLYRKEIKEYFETMRTYHMCKRSHDDMEAFFSGSSSSKTSFAGSLGKNLGLSMPKSGLHPGASMGALGKSSFMGIGLNSSKKNITAAGSSMGDLHSPDSVNSEGAIEEKMTPDLSLRHILSSLYPYISKEFEFVKSVFFSLEDVKSKDLDVRSRKRINTSIQCMLEGLNEELHAFVDYSAKLDNTFALSILVQITNSATQADELGFEFFSTILKSLKEKSRGFLEKFIDDQMKSIDEVKIDGKKRIGILQNVKVFPFFVNKMEESAGAAISDVDTRNLLNDCYKKLIYAIFKNLNNMSTISELNNSSNELEEKQSQTIDIINVENHHHLYTQLRGLKLNSLETFVKESKRMYEEHLTSYCQITVKRAMGKFYDYFEGISDLLKTKSAEDVAFQPAYNKASVKKLLSQYPLKEMKKTIDALYKKVERHFSDDEEGLSNVVWRHMQDEIVKKLNQYTDIVQRCYTDPNIQMPFSHQDILNALTQTTTESGKGK